VTSFGKIATVTCVAVICGAVILVYKENANQRKFVREANEVRSRAERGDAKAQDRLGSIFYYGKGVPQDYAEAIRWYRKAAEQGNAMAQNALASMYDRGTGLPQDYVEAVRWSRKAADKGDAKGQYSLAYMYHEGRGVPQDYTEAARWARKAADKGLADAQYSLGNSYRDGQGVPRDYAEAVRWYYKAAEQGEAKAQYALGYMYSKGQGVVQDDAEAMRWYDKAAEQGDAKAQRALGFVSRRGRRVPLTRWTFIVPLLFCLVVMLVPRRRWGRATWLSWALLSIGCAVSLADELLLSGFSLALLARGLPGILWGGSIRALLIALLAGGAVICAVMAVVEAVRGSKRPRDQGRPPSPPEWTPVSPT
jgi:TPR repeat protein